MGGRLRASPKKTCKSSSVGSPQPIKYFKQEDVPVTAGIVVDHSGSMGPKIGQVISAAQTFAKSSNPHDEMFVINFNEHVVPGLPPGVSFTGDPQALEAAINNFPSTGRTALYDAVIQGIDHLVLSNQKEKILLVIGDGGDNASKHDQHEVMEAVEKSDAIVYCIGLFDASDLHPNPGFLRNLGRKTGGEAFFPRETEQAVSLLRADRQRHPRTIHDRLCAHGQQA